MTSDQLGLLRAMTCDLVIGKTTPRSQSAIRAAVELIDKLKKTEDGEPLVPGMTVYWTLQGVLHVDTVRTIGERYLMIIPTDGPDEGLEVGLLHQDVYSTRELAEAAQNSP